MSAFIDTNVLIYAQGAGAKSETARQVILAGGVISVQVLNEFAAVLRRKLRLEWDVIAGALADVRAALGPVRPIDIGIHLNAVALARPRLQILRRPDRSVGARGRLRHPADGGPSDGTAHRRTDHRQSVRLNVLSITTSSSSPGRQISSLGLPLTSVPDRVMSNG